MAPPASPGRPLVPTSGEPPRFSRFPDLARNETEYARYEPAYDGEFLEMCHWCGRCSAVPTVVVPATARDAEVMCLWAKWLPSRMARGGTCTRGSMSCLATT